MPETWDTSGMTKVNANLVEQCEAAVKLLCEKSQAPHDDFDVMAQKLGDAADAFAASLDT